MIWLYRFLFPFLLLIASPYYLLRMAKRGGYRQMMAGRLGMYSAWPKQPQRKRIWIQAVSVGELLAVGDLIKCLESDGSYEVFLTTTTSTGFALAKDKYDGGPVRVASFPLDFFLFSARAWRAIQPDGVILMEGELWPEHIHQAYKRKVPLILVNARLSDKSFRRMQKVGTFCRSLFYDKITAVGAGSEVDAKRILELGFEQTRLSVTGNMKFDVVNASELSQDELKSLSASVAWQIPEHQAYPILIGAATWPGEEKLLIDTVLRLRSEGLNLRLMLVPRHMERRQELKLLLAAFPDVAWHFRSVSEWKGQPEKGLLDLCVADTTGELRKLLQLASIAYIGKSFPPHKQGQTPVEAAALGVPIIYGQGMANFRSICAQLESRQGAFRVRDAHELEASIRDLCGQEKLRQQRIIAARSVFESNLGSTESNHQHDSKQYF
jgi:3-deoxy-D-manno-octulosonic-acid transferase